jgi:hypothetical protein
LQVRQEKLYTLFMNFKQAGDGSPARSGYDHAKVPAGNNPARRNGRFSPFVSLGIARQFFFMCGHNTRCGRPLLSTPNTTAQRQIHE